MLGSEIEGVGKTIDHNQSCFKNSSICCNLKWMVVESYIEGSVRVYGGNKNVIFLSTVRFSGFSSI